MSRAWVALGANLGDRQATLRAALRRLADLPGLSVEAVSSLYESAAELPPGALPAPPFLNAVARIATALAPRALLWHLLRIEAGLGRRREAGAIGRTVDLDLLAAGDSVIHEPDLILPHPRLAARAFVRQPLLEIDPGWRHPATGRPLSPPGRESADGCRCVAAWTGVDWRRSGGEEAS